MLKQDTEARAAALQVGRVEAGRVSTGRPGGPKVFPMAKNTGMLLAGASEAETAVQWKLRADLAGTTRLGALPGQGASFGFFLCCQPWQTVLSKHLIKGK